MAEPRAQGTRECNAPSRDVHRIVLGQLTPAVEKATYKFEGGSCTTPYTDVDAPSASAALVRKYDAAGERINLVVLLGTPETATALDEHTKILGAERCRPIPVDVGDASDVFVEQIARCILTAADDLGGKAELVVDLTHSYRHLGLLLFMAAQYVAELRAETVSLCAAFYGLFDRKSGTTQMHEMGAVLRMPKWVNAVRAFTGDFDASALIERLEEMGGNNTLTTPLRHMSIGVHSGLPLEVGRVSDAIRQVKRPLAEHALLGDELWRRIDRMLAPLQIEGAAKKAAEGWKRDHPLTTTELERQAAFIDLLLKMGNVADATCLIEEWLVSWFVLRQCGKGAEWLDYPNTRRRAAGAIQSIGAAKEKTDAQRKFGRAWDNIVELRNGFAHHGMRPEDGFGRKAVAGEKKIREDWTWLKAMPPDIDLPKRVGAVLLTPIGMTSGVVYSAVLAWLDVAPRDADLRCVVLASAATEPFIDAAIAKARETAGARLDDLEILPELTEPFGRPGMAVGESIGRLARRLSNHLEGAATVSVNLTGGTTFMGLVAQATADLMRRGNYDVRTFGLIDQRPIEVQRAKPFVRGEAFWLDAATDEPAAAGEA